MKLSIGDKSVHTVAEGDGPVHALDRALQWNDLVVPQWYSPNVRIAYWSRYGQPKQLPGLTPAFLQVWWFDETLANQLPGPSKL